MAVLKLWKFNSQSRNSNLLPTLLILKIFLFPSILEAAFPSLSFNFTFFDPNLHDIVIEKDASLSGGEIIMTTLNQQKVIPVGRAGRATYVKPLHLWDKASGNLTNFTTCFSFVMNSQGNDKFGDGLTFFLAPNGSRIPPDVQGGGGLGLVSNDTQALNTEENVFVAVEFDTFFDNKWDPQVRHVGINVNSMESVALERWQSNVQQGNRTDVWIRYDSSQKLLSVRFVYVDMKNLIDSRNVSQAVDLAQCLPEWVTFGFSGSTGNSSQITTISSWAFFTDEIDNPNNTEPRENPTRRINKSGIAGVVAGLSAVACAVIVGIYFFSFGIHRRTIKDENTYVSALNLSFGENFKAETGLRNFAYDELVEATNNFIEDAMLGEGGFGTVYKGFLKDLNCFIAVKRISGCSKQGIKQFESEIKIISRLRHRNLVKLIGWCNEKELLLAYEFMPNGSLDSHLFKEKCLLTWKMRYNIVQGLASALLYLHEEGEQCVLHRDIKPSNIMLDLCFNSKLGDFGWARLVDHAKGSKTTVMAGTIGYIAPECFASYKASKESDIYSFGVVALEIACGRRAVETGLREEPIVEWVLELYGKGKLLEAADKKLDGEFDKQQMERLLIIGLCCVNPNHRFRPSMRQVMNLLLSFEAPLPTLSSETPAPTFLAPTEKINFILPNA